jgi:hypothetical protein
MAMDPVQFNRIFNALKELVGSEGSFVLLTYKMDPLDGSEAFQTRWHGSLPRQLMLMRIGDEQHKEHFKNWMEQNFKGLPKDPD